MLTKALCSVLTFLIISSVLAVPATSAEEKPRDLDTHHLFSPPDSLSAWETRRAELRRQVLFSAGLWPMPPKTALNPRVTGKVDAEDYTIENVALETRPGFFLCGNLYRPKGKKGPYPGIVNPHGHWIHGRLEMQPDVPKADPNGKMGDGRGNLVAIGVNLARQGFVVFAYDAVGYNDTKQVDHEFAKSLKAWAYGVSELGLQLWDSIRVVDYLQSLKFVDKNRIGCTGASGGGSQTFLLTAVDDRVKVSVPVNMVSAHMQGGCLCENGPGLRVGTDNVEIASITAPRPMLMVACTGDWTANNPKEEWPAVKKIYDLYGAGDKTAVVQFNYQHNYNVESREAMYAWFGKWFLNDPDPEHFREKPFTADVAAMHVWNDRNPLPASALREEALTKSLIEEGREALVAAGLNGSALSSASGRKRFRDTYKPALENSLSASYPMHYHMRPGSDKERVLLIVTTSEMRGTGEQLASAMQGKYRSVKVLDLPPVQTAEADLWKAYFSTYNRPPLGDRVQKVLNEIATIEANGAPTLDVVGIGDGGAWALLARGLSSEKLRSGRTVVDLGQIDLASDTAFLGPLYAPGIRRAGDLVTAAALCAPSTLQLYNVGAGTREALKSVEGAFTAAGGSFKAESAALSPAEIAKLLAE